MKNMKNIIFISLLCLILTGCTTASGTWVDVAARRYINEGKIYIGMSEEEFLEVLKPSSSYANQDKISEDGIKRYRWKSYWWKEIEFWFKEGKLIGWYWQ